VDVLVRRVDRVDLTGDGAPDAVVNGTCTGMIHSRTWLEFFAGGGAQPMRIGAFPPLRGGGPIQPALNFGRLPDGVVVESASAEFRNGSELSISGTGMSADGVCCPDMVYETSAKWAGDHFEQSSFTMWICDPAIPLTEAKRRCPSRTS
jgi:hypothetical protein